MDKSGKKAYFLAVLLKSLAVTLFYFLFSSNASALTYCAAKGTVSSYEYIKAVSVNGLTSNSSAQGYNLFTSPVFTLAQGSNSINLTPGFNYGTYNEGWSVFIDLNQDGTFGTDERLLTASSSTSISGTINIPTTAKAGTTRMRVIMQYSTPRTTPCGNFTYGEVEDYSVNINVSTRVETTTTVGFDRAYNKELVIEARYYKNNVIYLGSFFFYTDSAPTRPATIDVDKNTTIEWTAHIYLDYTPSGIYIPANCSNIVANKCITSAGAVGESVIFKEQTPITPPPTPKISTTVTAGFNHVDSKDLVIEAKFTKDGSSYVSSNYYYANSQTLSNPVTIEADINTNIEWSAHIYGDNGASGIYIPASCSSTVSNKCITAVGAMGQSVIFKDPSLVEPPPPVTPGVDLALNFEDLFSGLTYKPGPTISLGSNISATTTAPYFYYKTGAPFNSGYFAFGNLTLDFPAPVLSINFKATGACTNCTQTVQVTADGQPAGSFILNYQVISTVSLTFPTPVTKISFNQNFGMDDLAIDYQ